MERKTQRRGTAVSKFLMMLAISRIMEGGSGTVNIKGSNNYGFTGAPIYTPRRGKFKGYMRDKNFKAKRNNS